MEMVIKLESGNKRAEVRNLFKSYSLKMTFLLHVTIQVSWRCVMWF